MIRDHPDDIAPNDEVTMASKREHSAGDCAPARTTPKGRTKKKKQVQLTAAEKQDEDGPAPKHWRSPFLRHLAETSNITLSAGKAGVSTARVYRTRREDAVFYARFRAALLEGYELLEMELLGHLRTPDPERKFDVTAALRALAAHRATVALERSRIDGRSEEEVLASIDRKIDEMRARAAANALVIAETSGGADDGDE